MSESPVLHLDREGARHDLQVELAAVAGADLVEAVVAVGDHPGEDVEPAGRALRVRLGAHVLGQRQLLDQRHQVGPVALEHGAVAQVDPLEGEALDLLLDRRVDVGQEAAAQRPGEVAEAQVDAGRLDRLGADPVVAGADPLGLDRLGSAPAREGRRVGVGASRHPRGDYSPRLLGAQVGRRGRTRDLRKKLARAARLRRPGPAGRAARRCRRPPPRRSPRAPRRPPGRRARPRAGRATKTRSAAW